MFNILRIVSVLALCAAPLLAGPVAVENVVVLNTRPTSLRDGHLESDTNAFLFRESGFRASSGYSADWGGFAAGASVESWMIHYDPVGSDHIVDADAGVVEFTFDEVILGVDFRSETLDAGDAMFGAADVEYRQGEEFRGTEMGEHDGLQLSADGHSIVFDLKVWYANADEFRIFTGGWDDLNTPTPNPEPGTLVLCGAGVAYFIWRRRR